MNSNQSSLANQFNEAVNRCEVLLLQPSQNLQFNSVLLEKQNSEVLLKSALTKGRYYLLEEISPLQREEILSKLFELVKFHDDRFQEHDKLNELFLEINSISPIFSRHDNPNYLKECSEALRKITRVKGDLFDHLLRAVVSFYMVLHRDSVRREAKSEALERLYSKMAARLTEQV